MFATKYVTVISVLLIVCGVCRAGRSTTLCGVPGVLLPLCPLLLAATDHDGDDAAVAWPQERV